MTAVLLLCLIFNYKFMKKKSECLGIYHYRWQKIGKIMKLCIILVCLFSFSLSATTLAQRERVNMKLQDVSLRQVLEQIREQTNLQFMMSKEQGERVGRVSVDAVNETVVEVLDKIFASTGLTWVVKEDIIVVKERPQQQMRNPARVKGVVKDQKGHPLPGVTVLIKGTALGVVTDADGNYSLELPGAQGVRLIFSFIGMKTQEMAYTGQAELNIVMQEDITEMDEVVVTGYQNIKKENATGSYQTITSKELERRYSTDIISSLEGMLSGLVSYNKGLNDDAESNIMIRGVSTFTDRTKPLVVVDGLPIEGSIETINPYDISSITVLKDASAASIYGVRASNGVIVVTTKRAQNDRVEVNFNMDITINEKQQYDNYGWANAAQTIELEEKSYAATMQDPMYSQYIPMYVNMYPSSINPILSMLVQRDAGTLTADEYNRQIERLKKNDYLKEWSDAVLRNQVLQQYNMAFRAKGNRLTSSINLNFKRSNQGIVNEHNNILNFSYRGDIYAAKWLDVAVGFNANMVRSKKHIDALGYLLSPTGKEPYHTIYDENGNRAYYNAAVALNDPVLQNTSLGFKSEAYNLLDELDRNFTRARNSNLRSFVYATFKILPQLSVNAQFQYEDITNKSESYLEEESYDMRHIYHLYTSGGKHLCPDGGILTTTQNSADHYTFRVQANYAQVFKEKHHVEAIVGVENRETNTRNLNNRLLGYKDKTQTNTMASSNLNAARNLQTSDLGPMFSNPWMTFNLVSGWETAEVKHRYVSGYFTGNYTYDRRYSLSGSWRIDKTDLFGADPKYRGRPLWSVGAGWNINNEAFMASAEWINVLKLRASYGLTGNIDQSVSSFLTGRIYNNSTLNGALSAGVNTPPNEQLRWEKTTSYNVGMDYALWGHRLFGALDVYYKYSSDLLSSTDLDPSEGFTSLTINNGEAVNKGVELALNAVILKPSKPQGLGIKAHLNFAVNKNEIKKITTDVSMGINKLGWGSTQHVLQKGYPINSLYAFRFAGFKKEEGYYQLAWYKADGNTSTEGVYSALEPEDVVFAGGMDPKYTGSFVPEITWKGFTLNAMFAYYGGHYMRANASAWQARGSFLGYGNGALASCLNYWNDPEAGIYMPQGVYSSSMKIESQGLPFIDQCVFPADYLKLRNIVLSYDLPRALCAKCRIGSARLRFQMNNVATWVKNSLDIDPEANNAWTGTHLNKTPRSYTISLNINF